MKKLYIKPGENLKDAELVRIDVFVEEQGYSREQEFDNIDATANHVVLYARSDEPIGTGRIYENPNEKGRYILGRIAVIKEHRGKSLGAAIVGALEAKGKEIGATSFYLCAQSYASGFYEKLGYGVCGEEYMDGHVPHMPMDKHA